MSLIYIYLLIPLVLCFALLLDDYVLHFLAPLMSTIYVSLYSYTSIYYWTEVLRHNFFQAISKYFLTKKVILSKY